MLPSFISFDDQTMTFEVYSTTDSDARTYTLVTEIAYTSSFDTWRRCETTLEVASQVNITVNTKPYFIDAEDFSPLDAAICGQPRVY